MSFGEYSFSVKSMEQRGATLPNIVRIGLNSDDDIATFASNLQLCINGTVVSANKNLDKDYALPYPAGSGITLRCTAWSSGYQPYTFHLREFDPTKDINDFMSDLVAAGFRLPFGSFPLAVQITALVVNPGPGF